MLRFNLEGTRSKVFLLKHWILSTSGTGISTLCNYETLERSHIRKAQLRGICPVPHDLAGDTYFLYPATITETSASTIFYTHNVYLRRFAPINLDFLKVLPTIWQKKISSCHFSQYLLYVLGNASCTIPCHTNIFGFTMHTMPTTSLRLSRAMSKTKLTFDT